jgi:hypothetical protein
MRDAALVLAGTGRGVERLRASIVEDAREAILWAEQCCRDAGVDPER